MSHTKRKLTEYPIRTCKSVHHCVLCAGAITLDQKYYDGGYGRRAHVLCVDADEMEKKAKAAVEPRTATDPNFPEIFRAISESIEPIASVVAVMKGEWLIPLEASPLKAWRWELHGSTLDWQPRNWLDPAAAMELLKRLVIGNPCDGWDRVLSQLNENLEEAIVLATYAAIQEKGGESHG